MSYIADLRRELKTEASAESTPLLAALLVAMNSGGAERAIGTLLHNLCQDDSSNDSTLREWVTKALARLSPSEAEAFACVDALAAVALNRSASGFECDDSSVTEDDQHALELIWRSLAPRIAGMSLDSHSPREIMAVQSRLNGRQHSVLFPTARTTTDRGDLFRAKVVVVPPTAEWESVGRPQQALNIAPWSKWRLGNHEIKALNDLLQSATLLEILKLPDDQRYLLEIERVFPNDALPRVDITGESLTVAVVLAVWAAHHQRELRPLAVTGEIKGHNIELVGGVLKKARVIAEASKNGIAIETFLYPKANRGEVTGVNHLPMPETLADLLALDTTLLTDGFDRYRQLFNASPPPGSDGAEQSFGDIEFEVIDDEPVYRSTMRGVTLQQQQDEAIRSKPVIVSVPFGDEPRPVAEWLVHQLMNHGTPAQQPVATQPVFLPMNLNAISGTDVTTQWVSAVYGGIQLLAEHHDAPLVERIVLQNLIMSRNWDHLVLVVYAGTSLDVAFDLQQRFWRSFRTLCGNRSPYMIYVASDLHHALFLKQALAGTHNTDNRFCSVS